ncbi:MAG: hypothetical protein LBI54_09170 [Lachnospiraceae bacterium]|jgi:hypothetical protein|nr:hypothetical protein [Lachnospiraceae bacterium]
MNEQTYTPSGKLPPAYWLFFALFSLVGIPILSVAYIYLVHYIPYIYLCFFLTIGCGAGLGAVIALAVKLGKARNPIVVAISAGVAALVMKYVQWCVYVPLIFDEVYDYNEYNYGEAYTVGEQLLESVSYLLHPLWVFADAKTINEYGVWGFSQGGGAVTGVFLVIIWLLELVIIVGVVVLIPMNRVRHPYSEWGDAWYKKSDQVFESDIPDDFPRILNDFTSGNVAPLADLIRAGRTDTALYLRYVFLTPPDGGSSSEPYFMSVTRFTVDSKNKAQSAKIVNDLLVARSKYREIKEAINDSRPVAADTPPAPVDDYA